MAAFKLARKIFLVLTPKMSTRNFQKSGFSLSQSLHRTHPFIHYNSHIKHYTSHYTTVIHNNLQDRSVICLKTKSFDIPLLHHPLHITYTYTRINISYTHINTYIHTHIHIHIHTSLHPSLNILSRTHHISSIISSITSIIKYISS